MRTRILAIVLSALVGTTAPFVAPTATAQNVAGPYLAATQANFRNDYAAAARYYSEAAAEDADNPFLLQNAILNLVIAGDFPASIPFAKQLESLGADMQLGGLILVADAIERDAYGAAMDLLERDDLRLNPLLAGLLKGWVAAGMGETTRAGELLDEMSADTNFGELAQYHKALVFALAGNFDGASEIFAGDEMARCG